MTLNHLICSLGAIKRVKESSIFCCSVLWFSSYSSDREQSCCLKLPLSKKHTQLNTFQHSLSSCRWWRHRTAWRSCWRWWLWRTRSPLGRLTRCVISVHRSTCSPCSPGHNCKSLGGQVQSLPQEDEAWGRWEHTEIPYTCAGNMTSTIVLKARYQT